MTQDDSSNGNINQTITAVADLAKVIPIYPDLIQPAAKEIGKSLGIVFKAVNVALSPLKFVVWGYEQVENFLNTSIAEKLKNIPTENIIEPPLLIAGPVAEALRFAGHDENLRELYANLLATAMDKETVSQAHPGFIEILKNITSDEAILLRAFVYEKQYPLLDIHAKLRDGSGYQVIISNYSYFSKRMRFTVPDLIPSYIDNLCRLGILEIPSLITISTPNTYEQLENDPEINDIKIEIEKDNIRTIGFERKVVRVTNFGKLFIQNVVTSKS